MLSNAMFIASSVFSPPPSTLFGSHKICSSFKTISKQSHAFLHRNPFFLHHLNLGSKRALSSVCFSNAGDKALCFLTFVFYFSIFFLCNYFPGISVYKLSWELLFDAV
ncbi:hypothetical protein V8G54_023082 [Vigna mungo]|uniref:Uncharacterized protein n=1 Tax=Vigna mungo TaxID=3915 RepID=A0AAQ3N435_VIGMU